MSADPSVKCKVCVTGGSPHIEPALAWKRLLHSAGFVDNLEFLLLHPHKSTCVEEPSVWSMLVRHLVSEVLVPTRCQSVGATMGDRAHGSWRCPHFAQAGPECVLFSSREMPQ